MLSISTADAQARYTKMLIDVYRQRSTPTSFLRTFFKDVTVPTLEVSIEVQRGKEKVAADVVRGTDGNRNQWTRSTEKSWIPPYFREWFDATQLQLYDRLYGATEINDSIFAAYINDVADHIMELQEKIERAVELQCAQVLETGVISIASDTGIDFHRKTASMVDPGAGNYWATGTTDPFNQLEAGCKFLRQVGKAGGNMFIALCGGQALTDLLSNTIFLKRQNLFSMALDAVNSPQMGETGATYHGTLTCGSYKVQLWAYPQYYDNAAGVSTPYLNEQKVTLIPVAPKFKIAYAAVPQLLTPSTPPFIGKYKINEYIDQRGKARIVDIESAPLAIPTAIDTIYTLKAVAD
jgi:hypothetical protein